MMIAVYYKITMVTLMIKTGDFSFNNAFTYMLQYLNYMEGKVYNSKRDCGKRNLVEFLLNELFPNRFEECNRDYLIMKYIINIKEV